ncbi:PREDICTED: uncharacterized protein LOC105966808 isoform X3 [Erythranthe guttata]|uniref:uncharacterized protein LOC105966808 isoform X1 n=1 Tax=Erythranthe guttata TaxID=4155 RepID=UPI00064D78B2|nr:PREDICTED: uncharacterized protein LOC105966808 isoform X1 [Erythranthe guttata]XP_012846842.1 PREDICTED: uncharacterized protein LOC105966808 isoform X2 [Erythranthe guttata]XP_012846843.1 PREDICTED: uncharacterized protein LOC105966808 isoform X3 [Erythranthe guttata]|eukprot:XP_012846841.1 PREDICTED: uncharacterized protein LOC105966808 isoform X1 [Erythranthe guttata]
MVTKNILAGKLAWKALEGTTLWARFVRAKYGENFHNGPPLHSTPLWKEVHKHFETLENHTCWIVGKGSVDFWRDKWIQGVTLDEHKTMTFKEAKSKPQECRSFLSQEQQHIFDLIEINEMEEDRLIFTKSTSGNFTVSEYWDLVRHKNPRVKFTKKIWHPHIPLKVGAFFWKLAYGAIPVDLALQKRGYPYPSKCRCCEKPSQESLTHLFAQSDVARGVWKYYADLWLKPWMYGSMQHLIKAWTHDFRRDTQEGLMALGILMIGCWEIWKNRCRAVFEDIPMNTATIIRNIFPSLVTLNDIMKVKLPTSQIGRQVMQALRLPLKAPFLGRGIWVKWIPPEARYIKGNVDGSLHGTACSGGGLFRTHDGHFIHGFSHIYGPGSHIWAEASAILDGLQMSTEMGFDNIIIESDAKLVVDMIYQRSVVAWDLNYVVQGIRRHLSANRRVVHTLREGNYPADSLAKLAHGHRMKIRYRSISELPSSIKRLILMDRLGYRNFRKGCHKPSSGSSDFLLPL